MFKNYRPISLPHICGNFFERLLYKIVFKFYPDSGLISLNQSGLKPGDSCTKKLIFITYNIYNSFTEGREVRGVSLDILKAFDKVSHKSVFLKNKTIWNK